ncbi:hypothetical protein M9H77_16980 [Catharanthus roseus]|uniref:Uncharacterized protein n=1 Tax=Catharanthus roseus TaxID=4058 RepID=A0ACC0B3B0_CATRO|nr:hypothetical protein M9H77_16980 [Catharanthus roseus]
MLKREKIKEASRVEESSRGIKLPQAKIEIEESVEVHVEEEMSKEDFCDSMNDISFEEEESIEIERKDRVEEKERLDEKSSFFDCISSLGVANHHTFGFLENNSYGFDGSLFSLLGDRCVKFQEEVVEHFQYVLTSLDTYVNDLVEQILVDKPLLVVKGLLEHFWHRLKFLFVERSFKTLFEKAFGSNSFMCIIRSSCCQRSLKTKWVLILKLLTLIFHDILDTISLVADSFASWTLMKGMIPSDFLVLFVRNFLFKKVEGYLCSLIGDLLNKSIRRNVEKCAYMVPSFETFAIALKEISPFENHFLNVDVQLESRCDDHKLLIGIEVSKDFLIETILGLQFYLLHFEESMFLLICENKKKSGFGVLKVFHIVL